MINAKQDKLISFLHVYSLVSLCGGQQGELFLPGGISRTEGCHPYVEVNKPWRREIIRGVLEAVGVCAAILHMIRGP